MHITPQRIAVFLSAILLTLLAGCGGGGGGGGSGGISLTPPDVAQPVEIVFRTSAPLMLRVRAAGGGIQTITINADSANALFGVQTITLTDMESEFDYNIAILQPVTITQSDGGMTVLMPQTIVIATDSSRVVLMTVAGEKLYVANAAEIPADYPDDFIATEIFTNFVTLAPGESPGGVPVFSQTIGTFTIAAAAEPFYIPDGFKSREQTPTITVSETATVTMTLATLQRFATITTTITLTNVNTMFIDGASTIMLTIDTPGLAAVAVAAAVPGQFAAAAAADILQPLGVTLGRITITADLGSTGPHPIVATVAVYVISTNINVSVVPVYESYYHPSTITTTTTLAATAYLSTTTVTTTMSTTVTRQTTTMAFRDGTVALYRDKRFAFAVLPPPNDLDDDDYRSAEFLSNYGLGQMKADAAYQRGYWGAGVTVGIVDSGMLTSHVDLRDRVVPGYNAVTGGTVITDPTIVDPQAGSPGHGTAVAGIVGASKNDNVIHGVAPSVSLMPLQIGDHRGFLIGNARTAFSVALENGVHILNNSYGPIPAPVFGTYRGTTYWTEIPYFAPLITPSQLARIDETAEIAGNADAVWVWATGNDGWQTLTGGQIKFLCSDLNAGSISDCSVFNRKIVSIQTLRAEFSALCGTPVNLPQICGLLGTIQVTVSGKALGIPETGSDYYNLFPHYYPQLTDRWLAVVATGRRFAGDNDRRLWAGSNGCGDAMFWCLAAPGQGILTTDNAYNGSFRSRTGTSFAAPHVSGALAVLKSRLPSMPMAVVRALLLVSADDLGATGVDPYYGWGFVNLERAVTLQGSVQLAAAPPADDSSPPVALSLVLPPPNPENDRQSFHTEEFARNYGLATIGADYAYARGYFGQEVTVAVVDTGMLTTHIDLRDNIIEGFDFAFHLGTPIVDEPITSYNKIGHGTAVAGVIAAVRNTLANSAHGVAPSAKIIALQIGNRQGELVLDTATTALKFAVFREAHIVNNSYDSSIDLVGDYNGVRYHVKAPSFSQLGAGTANFALAAALDDVDMALVWAAGDNGWHHGGEVNLCADIDSSLIGLTQCPDAMRLTLTPQQLIDGFVAENYHKELTVSLGVGGTAENVFTVNTPAQGALSVLGLPASGTGFYGRLPIAHPELMSRWLVAVATDENNELASFSNGCGDTKFWCLAAPGVNISTIFGTGVSDYGVAHGTSFAAPHISGALAVLKSRLPTMPMSAVRAILLHTAEDLGAAGIDDDYGWGLVDLEKAITLQGNVEIVLEENVANANVVNAAHANGVRVMGTRIHLPSGFASVREELAQISVAVSVFGNAHYNMPLGALVQVSPSVQTTLGNAAADMLSPHHERFAAGMFFAATDTQRFRYAGADLELQDFGAWRFQHNFCEACEDSGWAEWDIADDIATPFFAQDKSAFVMQMRGKGLRPFAAFSGEIGDADSLPYRQFGLRWTGGDERISFAAEASEIRESESFMGASFGALGETAAKTHQGKIIMRGALVGGWSGFASYERAHGEAKVAGGEFLQSISGLRAWGWKAGLQRQDILFGGDKLRLSAGRQTSLRRGDAVFHFAQARCTDGTAGDCFNEAVFGDIEGAPDFYKERSQELTSKRAQVSLSSVSSLLLTAGYSAKVWHSGEFSLGVEHDTGTKESAVSAQLQFVF